METSGVTFEDDEQQQYTPSAAVTSKANKGPGIGALVVKWGFAKDEKSAQVFLLVVCVLSFAAAALVTMLFLLPKSIPAPVPVPASIGAPSGLK